MAAFAWVIGDDVFLHCLLEAAVQHHVYPPDCAVCQGEIGGFLPSPDPSLLLGMVIHLLNVQSGELPQLDAPDGWG